MMPTRNASPYAPAFLAALMLAGCGGSSPTSTSIATPATTASPAPRVASRANGELLAVPAVGRLYGRCKPGDHRWTIKFATGPTANDGITYRIGTSRPRNVVTVPGKTVTWHLIPGQFATREPADRISHFAATTLTTTVPMTLSISQGTEPHIYRVNITFAVAAAIGDTADCALISTTLHATTYYPGGEPPS